MKLRYAVRVLISSLILFAPEVHASEAFLSEMCNTFNIVTGSAGKTFAAFSIVAVGVGFFSGKVSWGLMVGVSVGVASMFGAPSMVSAITGKSVYQCQEVTYRACVGSSCSCPTGFTGSTCSSCSVGYVGTSCDTCDVGYIKIAGICERKCSSGTPAGISTSVEVDPGSSTLDCDVTNFTGTLSYTCSDGSFSINSPCSCSGLRAGANCSSCITGYTLASNCTACDIGYTMSGGNCAQDCQVTGQTGIPNNTPAIPTSGTLSCTGGFNGTLNYSCIGGVFEVTSGACVIYDNCVGGNSISEVGGKTIHIFTSGGSFSCPSGRTIQYLVVGGGGGGGYDGAGGGGGGAVKQGSVSITAASYSVIVGGGGDAATAVGTKATNGQSSRFYDMASIVNVLSNGGGGGGSKQSTGANGSSGGGGGHNFGSSFAGGSGTGGEGYGGGAGGTTGGGGGGGAGGAGVSGSAANGGIGLVSTITGAPLYYGGGGGGGSYSGGSSGSGGQGGGGLGGLNTARLATAGTDGTGGGGGAGGEAVNNPSKKGGSGIVMGLDNFKSDYL